MPKVFALFTIGSMASLALPGMSGFASEIAVFVGMTTSDTYSSAFRVVTIFLSAVGVILTPIYLLSMLRQVFYGDGNMCDVNGTISSEGDQEAVCFGTDCVLPSEAVFSDASPREVFIAACFLSVIIAIGFYPKLMTQMYDATTVAMNSHAHESYVEISQVNPQLYAKGFVFPKVGEEAVLGLVK
jgi:NAD(P)H-quinone oxidoreductase subunit 4